MYEHLDHQELAIEKNSIRLKLEVQKVILHNLGTPAEHDKLYCLYRWQLGEIENCEAALVRG